MNTEERPIVVVSGGFDPVHLGHIRLFQEASVLGMVVVALNSDSWLTKKKGRPFMYWNERAEIISEFMSVYRVVPMNDSDGSAVDGIRKVKEMFPGRRIIFANGGDRFEDNIPEAIFCRENGIETVFNIGGGKANSSSKLVREFINSGGRFDY